MKNAFALGTRLLQNLEPKRRRKFNPPFKYTQTYELNISETLEIANPPNRGLLEIILNEFFANADWKRLDLSFDVPRRRSIQQRGWVGTTL